MEDSMQTTYSVKKLRPQCHLINGVERRLQSISIGGQILLVSGRILNIVRLEDEWYNELNDAPAVVAALTRASSVGADLLTFWQRPPHKTPMYGYHMELEGIAALSISDYDHWLHKQITSEARTRVRKAERSGVVVREAKFDRDFINGMVQIFNESALRQGRAFWHYGKDACTVERQFSRFLFREKIFGAYYDGNLIGFIFLGISQDFANLGQILSLIEYRNKATNNALIAKAVEFCASAGIPYLTYENWPPVEGLATFKRRNGFQRMEIPRYYVPLSWKGRLALRYGLHHDWKDAVPPPLRARLKQMKGWLAEIQYSGSRAAK